MEEQKMIISIFPNMSRLEPQEVARFRHIKFFVENSKIFISGSTKNIFVSDVANYIFCEQL